jgi:hypothetical protein
MRNRTSELAAFALSVQFAGNRCFARTKDRLSAGRVQVHERKQGPGRGHFRFKGLGVSELTRRIVLKPET